MENEFIAMARNVYSHLNDEISKKIFEAKCLYAMTGDIGALTGIGAKYRNLNSDMEVYASKFREVTMSSSTVQVLQDIIWQADLCISE